MTTLNWRAPVRGSRRRHVIPQWTVNYGPCIRSSSATRPPETPASTRAGPAKQATRSKWGSSELIVSNLHAYFKCTQEAQQSLGWADYTAYTSKGQRSTSERGKKAIVGLTAHRNSSSLLPKVLSSPPTTYRLLSIVRNDPSRSSRSMIFVLSERAYATS